MNLSLLSPEHQYVLHIIQKHADPYIDRRVVLSYVQRSSGEPENPFKVRSLINKVRDVLVDLEEYNCITVSGDGIRLLSNGQ